eukprot:XP_001697642.1 sulfate transporter [Chlamydomonas reinhardtii]
MSCVPWTPLSPRTPSPNTGLGSVWLACHHRGPHRRLHPHRGGRGAALRPGRSGGLHRHRGRPTHGHGGHGHGRHHPPSRWSRASPPASPPTSSARSSRTSWAWARRGGCRRACPCPPSSWRRSSTCHLDATHVPSLAMATGCLVAIKVWPKEWAKVRSAQPRRGPGHRDHWVALRQRRHPAVAARAAVARRPHLSMETLPGLIYPATTIALLAAIESLLCARVSDGMIGDRHDSNTELISQGVANIACAAFGCLPATGALARTAANVRAGGRSPVAAVVLAGAGPLAENIPLPALSAVLVIVAVNMGEWHNFTDLPKWPKNDMQLFLIAFSLTVLMDVAVAVTFGMAIALAIFVQDVSATMYVRALPPRSIITPPDHELPLLPGELAAGGAEAPASPDPYRRSSRRRAYAGGSSSQEDEDPVEGPQPTAAPALATAAAGGAVAVAPAGAAAAGGLLLSAAAAAANPAAAAAAGYLSVVPAGVVYVEVTGSLLFGAGEMLEKAVAATHTADPVQVLVLNLSRVPVVDVSGLEVLEESAAELERAGKGLVVCGLTRQPLRMMARAGFLDMVRGRD